MIISKRFFLFFLVNILVLLTLTITWSLISAYFGLNNTGYTVMLLFCLFLGMGGAFISLLLSKKMAVWLMRVQIIDPKTVKDSRIQELFDQVHRMSKAAGLSKIPEVGIYESHEVNAFATGPSRRNSLVAVSTGLLHRLNKEEVEAVIGHEVAHISNGDMVTMTLLQGIINTLVLFVAKIIGRMVASQVDERFAFAVHLTIEIVLQILLSILGSIVVSYYSRQREFRADAGAAKFAGREKMISALKALAGNQDFVVDTGHEAMASFKIIGIKRSRLAHLFSTHPPIKERIRRLEMGR